MGEDLRQQLDTMTLGQWQARQIVKAARILALFVESTREDKLRWKPAIDEHSQTRSALEQVGECVFANRRFRRVLLGETPPAAPPEFDLFDDVQDDVSQSAPKGSP